MAKMNGIQIKSLKTNRGHEGEPCYYGNLYIDNKKVAFWAQDTHGSIVDDIQMESGFSEKKIRSLVSSLNKDKAMHGTNRAGEPFVMEYELEFLLVELVELMEDEKFYKKAVKEGYYSYLSITDGFHYNAVKIPKSYGMTKEEIAENCKDLIEEGKQQMFKNKEDIKVNIYTSLDDFQIGTPIHLDEIRC